MSRTLLFLLISVCLKGQTDPLARNAFLNPSMQSAFDFWSIAAPSTSFHSSFRPYLSSTFINAPDSAVPFSFYGFRNISLTRRLNDVENPNALRMQVQPLADITFGYDPLQKNVPLTAAAGLYTRTELNRDLTLSVSGFGGRASFPFHLDSSIRERKKYLPGIGQGYSDGQGGYQFFDVTGYLSYSPRAGRVFNLQVGRDKHFIGDGIRSLLLSDYSGAYPYARINVNVWRMQYNVWYSWLSDVSSANGRFASYRNKFGAFHYLSFNIIKELNLSIFENVVWRGSDTNQSRTFDVNYLNPVIFYRPVEYANGSPDNSFIGVNLSGTLWKRVKLYGQLALDEFFLTEIRARRGWWGNKQGWQFGGKYINAFGVKGLKLQAEYNEVRPYTYTHGLVDQNYGHLGMALAHPLGANFREIMLAAEYRKKRIEISGQLMYAVTGRDSAGGKTNVGQNIFLSYTTRDNEYGNYTTQGIRTRIIQSHLKAVWHVLPALNGRIELGYIQRSESSGSLFALESPFIYLAFRTTFWNHHDL